ncbi:MAG: AraC family transcriptional regulator [Lachnospiraceae bacterium]
MGDMSITKKILLYIENNLDKELSLEKIAKELSYSKFYIARTFKDNTGTTLYKYIQGRRLDEAARKLAETKQPIVEIAFEAGYSSQQAFTRSFRCTYICTPQQYRRIGIFTPKQSRIHMGIRRQPVIFLFRPAGGRIAA